MSLFDDWHSSQAQQQAQKQQQSRGGGGGGGFTRQTSSTLNDGYESDEHDERLPSDSRSANPFSSSRMPMVASQGNLSNLASSIITAPNDPSLAPVDQIGGVTSPNDDSPMFQLERLDWRPSKEQGALVGLAVGSGVLFIATSNCNIVRWNVDTDEFEEIVVSKRVDDRIHKVFLDPTGHHGIIAMENGQVYYMHSRWNKAHLLSKVKNVIIESIAWNSALGTENSTKKILIGTNRGLIYETCIEEKDKYFKKVHDLCFDDPSSSGSASGASSAAGGAAAAANDFLTTTTPVSGLYMELFPSSAEAGEANHKYFVMAATPNKQFQFIGGPTFEALFAKYTGSIPSYRDFPGDLGYSELRTFSKYQGRAKAATADSCAWMNGVGIYYGSLVFGSQDKGQEVLQNGKLLAYPQITDPATGQTKSTPPVSLTLTEFHFLLVMRNRLMAINQLSEEIVYEEVFNVSTFGEMQGLACDARKDTVWLYSDKFVFAVDIIKEDRDAWKLYLQEKKFELALEYCDTDQQIERVNNAKADYLFEQGNFEAAAKIYAETGRSFEEVALKFVNISSGLPVLSSTTLDLPKTLTSSPTAALTSSSSSSSNSANSSNNANPIINPVSPLSLTRLTPALQSEARAALKAYLLAKLNTLDPTELTQQVMICTWLTEIFLDNINRLQETSVESASSLLRKRGSISSATGVSSSKVGGAGLVMTTSPFPDMDSVGTSAGGKLDDALDDPTGEELVLLANERAEAREDEVREFRAFLVEYFDCLSKETTFELIASHGRIHELLYYAETIGDYEWVLNYHIQQANYFQALDILQNHENPSKIIDKYYKFCPTLMYYLPKQTVDMLIELGKTLDPSKLIPALMRYAESGDAATDGHDGESDEKKHAHSDEDEDHDDLDDDQKEDRGENQAIRYLEHMILKLKNRDTVIHNYLLSLYAKQKNEAPLTRFIESQRKRIVFDYKYALRICHEEGKYRACVAIYECMALYEEAVRMALEIDLELAKAVVARAQQEADLNPSLSGGFDDHQRKRLWILIARHVIDHEQDISKAMLILKECDVRLEEILPFFPDFVKIGEFKTEICKSLDTYNHKIEQLKSEMEEYTDSANLIRQDINALRSRFGVVTSNQKCDICSQSVLTRPFLLFPCTHTFHQSCCLAEAQKYLQAHPKRKQQVIEEALKEGGVHFGSSSAPAASGKEASGAGVKSSIDSLSQLSKESREQKAIEHFASSECCLCGELMIDSVATPFISMPDEENEARNWEI